MKQGGLLLSCWMLVGALSLVAQEGVSFRPRFLQHWIGPTELIEYSMPTGSDSKLTMTRIKKGGKALELSLPPPTLPKDSEGEVGPFNFFRVWFDGHALVAHYKYKEAGRSATGAPTLHLKHKFIRFDVQAGDWDFTNTQQASEINSFRFLSENRLVVVDRPRRQASGTWLPMFEVFRANEKGDFLSASIPDTGLSDSLARAVRDSDPPFMRGLPYKLRPIAMAKATVLYTDEGLFWCFAPEGRMKRMVRLYRHHDDDFLKTQRLWEGAVLDAQPTPEGNVLICAVHPGAAMRAEAFLNQRIGEKARTVTEQAKVEQTLQSYVFASDVGLQWFSLDPETGTLSETAAPAGLKNTLASYAEYVTYLWAFGPDGKVRPRPWTAGTAVTKAAR